LTFLKTCVCLKLILLPLVLPRPAPADASLRHHVLAGVRVPDARVPARSEKGPAEGGLQGQGRPRLRKQEGPGPWNSHF
jgi:hypothetical protein